MKNMKYTFGALLLLISLCSCSNLFNKDVTETNDSNTYVMLTSDSVSVRSISPTQEYALEKLKSITFSAKMDGKSKRTLASSVASLSVLYNYQFVLPDGAGSYTFELQGNLDNVNYYAKLTYEIKEGETNPISFALKPVKSSSDYSEFEDFGGISCTLNFNKTNVKKIHYKLENLSSSKIVEQGDITSFSNISNSNYNSKATYNHLANNTTGATARLPVGQYRLTFDFLTEDTSLGDFVLINSIPYIVNVESGRNSYLEENFDLNQVYTIIYNNDVNAELAPGQRKQTKFTHNDKVILPEIIKNKCTFQGWLDEDGNSITEIPKGTTENINVFAKFANSVLYVDDNGNDDNNGLSPNNSSEGAPLKTLGAALAKIKAIGTEDWPDHTDQNLDWYIYMSGNFTATNVLISDYDGEVLKSLKAKSITIVGASGLDYAGIPRDSITGDGTQPVFTISTPVSGATIGFKNIKITGGHNEDGEDGAGIVIKSSSKAAIEEGTLITGNTSTTNGAGIAVYDNATLILGGGTIQDNTLEGTGYGKDVYCQNTGRISLYGNPVVGELFVSRTTVENAADGVITLADNLKNGANITITPRYYQGPSISEAVFVSPNKYIFNSTTNPSVNIADNVKYIHVTQDSTHPETEWYICSDGGLNYDVTVSFAGDGTENLSDIYLPSCSIISSDNNPLPVPTRSGYIFVGWSYTKDGYQQPFEYKEYESDLHYTIIKQDMELQPAWVYDNATIYVDAVNGGYLGSADGSEDMPFKQIQFALNAIYIINKPERDYTIVMNGVSKDNGSYITGDYNIKIDENTPAKSITLQGTPGVGTGDDGIYIERVPSNPAIESIIIASGNVNVTIKDMKFQFDPTNRADKDGMVLSVKDGSAVTLENVKFEAGGDQESLTTGSAIAVTNGSSLIMNGTSLITNWQFPDGAVIVDNTSTFTMNGGSITSSVTGVHLKASGSNIANFIMNGGTISANSSHGIFIDGSPDAGVTGKITLGDTAVIATNNDIYLPDYITIEIASELTALDGDNTKIPTITPASYTRTSPVLALAQGAASSLVSEFSKFGVTKNGSTEYEITSEGKLMLSTGGGNGGNVPNDLAYLTGTNGVELESDTYWDGEGTRTVGNLYVGKTEITQTEYEKYMTYETGYSPTETGSDKSTYPAYFVSWNEAIIYCNLRSINEGLIPYYSMDGETDPRKWTDAGVVTTNGKCYLPVVNITVSTYETAGNNGMWEPTYVHGGGHLKFAEDSTDEGHYGYRLPCAAEWCYIAANSSSLEITDLTTKNVDEWVQAWDENGSSVGHYHVSGSINGTYDEDYDFTTEVNYNAVPNYAHEGTANIGFRVVRNAE